MGKDREEMLLICGKCKGNLFEPVRCFALQPKDLKKPNEGEPIPKYMAIAMKCVVCGNVASSKVLGRVPKMGDLIVPTMQPGSPSAGQQRPQQQRIVVEG